MERMNVQPPPAIPCQHAGQFEVTAIIKMCFTDGMVDEFAPRVSVETVGIILILL